LVRWWCEAATTGQVFLLLWFWLVFLSALTLYKLLYRSVIMVDM
jgi:hypothetical protein